MYLLIGNGKIFNKTFSVFMFVYCFLQKIQTLT